MYSINIQLTYALVVGFISSFVWFSDPVIVFQIIGIN